MSPTSAGEGDPGSVLYLTGFFPPDVVSKRAAGVAGALAASGWKVTVVARWPAGLDGRPFSAAELAEADATLPAGITVRRFGPPDRRAARPWRRILAQVAFAARATAHAVGSAGRHDVVLAYTPPPFTGLAAHLAAKLRRRPLVLEVQDLYPAQALALGVVRPGLVSWVAGRVERLLYRGARRLVVVTEGYSRHAQEIGTDAARVRVIPNSCDTATFRPDVTPRDAPWPRADVTVVFAGTVGLAQGSEVLLDAADALRDRPDIAFEVWGGGARYAPLQTAVAERGLANVRFGPPVPYAEMPAVLARADLLALTLHEADVFTRVVPSKLSEYLATGRPVLAAARGEVPACLEGAGAGLAVPPLDGRAFAAAVRRLADDAGLRAAMGKAARRLAEERFDDRAALSSFAGAVCEAAASGTPDGHRTRREAPAARRPDPTPHRPTPPA